MNTSTDEEYIHAFLEGMLPAEALHHRDHLRIAWRLSRQYDEQMALDLFRTGICVWANQQGYTALYHETLTRFWVRMVAQAGKQHPDLDFDAFLAACPYLLNKDLPFRYWSQATFWSPAARAAWVEPDRCRLPDEKLNDIGAHP